MIRNVLAFVCLVMSPGLWAALPSDVDGVAVPSLAPMLEETSPGVVNIATYARVRASDSLLQDPFFRRFFNVPQTRTQSAGSGVIIDAELGFVVTNHHVVHRADEIQVTLADGREYSALLVGVDPQVDLAVLRIDADRLVDVPFANSREVRVGDFVVAIGNPFGLDQTVTSGIVSALGRSGLGIEGYEDFIQTDASINRGNSGGALVDLRGRLVGINTAIVAPSGGNVGIGFAIPSNMVRAIADEIITHGEVRRGRIGLDVTPLTRDLAEAFGSSAESGVVVVEVEPGSVAELAGVQLGDILRAIDGRPVRGVSDYTGETAVAMVGDRLDLEILRDNEDVSLELQFTDNRIVAGDRLDDRLTGAELMDFRGEDDPLTSEGVFVTQVSPGTPAERQGLQAGDVIVAANGHRTTDVGTLSKRLRDRARPTLRVYRAGRFGNLTLR